MLSGSNADLATLETVLTITIKLISISKFEVESFYFAEKKYTVSSF